jgi:hypothetical protein
MILSYRTRRNLRRTGKFIVIAVVVAAIFLVLWMIWVSRYMFYHRDLGAQLDFNLPPIPEGQLATRPTEGPPLDLILDEEKITPDGTAPEVVKTSIQGYYLTDKDLTADNLPNLMTQLDALAPGTAVLMDVKAPKGWFYYTTDFDNRYEDQAPSRPLTVQQLDELIAHLDERDLHLIARLPAFPDYWFGRYNVSKGCGLAEKGKGGALWMDNNGCYWMDPTNEDALFYLTNIIRQLQSIGFDEVVFYDFRFPETDKIIFEGDKAQAIADAAVELATACATEQLCVSFEVDNPEFPLPSGNCRVYLKDVAAEDAETIAQLVPTDNVALHVLFITTDSNASDTRFEKYCILRPLESAR